MSGRDLVFEIGTEELPSSAVYSGVSQLQVSVPKALDAARLQYGEVAVVATPRRIAVLVSELAERQSDSVDTYKGPASKAAFDAEGNPTQAAVGFARGKGVPVESLEVVEDDSGSYVYATVETQGAPAAEVLPGLLARVVEDLEWAKSQRWGSGSARFPRPVRWLLAIHGTDVVPVEFAGLTAGRVTYGHRFLASGPDRDHGCLRVRSGARDGQGRGRSERARRDAARRCGHRGLTSQRSTGDSRQDLRRGRQPGRMADRGGGHLRRGVPCGPA